LDRRSNTSDGPSGASPTVVTERHDDDDDLIADTDQDTQIIPTTPVRAARAAVARAAAAAKEVLANGKPTTANGGPAADESAAQPPKYADAVAGGPGQLNTVAGGPGQLNTVTDEVPALPADTIGLGRDSSSFDRPVSAPVSPGADDWASAEHHLSSSIAEPAAAGIEPVEAESAVAETGTGWPVGDVPPDAASSDSSTAKPSGGPEQTVSAAAFVWDPPEPAPTSPSSPARNFLRSSTTAKAAAPPRTPPVSVTPPKASAGRAKAQGGRAKGSAKRSARQAHLTVARVEPWSVMKFSFVVSLIAFVILFVAVAIIYSTLAALGVFASLQHVVQSVTSSQDSSGVNASTWFTASRVLGYTALLGALNIVLITAMSTIGAVVYNLTSRLIGGVEVTLRETE
jgi:hypothetical protein